MNLLKIFMEFIKDKFIRIYEKDRLLFTKHDFPDTSYICRVANIYFTDVHNFQIMTKVKDKYIPIQADISTELEICTEEGERIYYTQVTNRNLELYLRINKDGRGRIIDIDSYLEDYLSINHYAIFFAVNGKQLVGIEPLWSNIPDDVIGNNVEEVIKLLKTLYGQEAHIQFIYFTPY